jgi:hypothetical protein
MLSRDELLKEISALLSDYEDRGKPSRSGYINPTDENLAQEDGERQAFAEVADSLKVILERAGFDQTPPTPRF